MRTLWQTGLAALVFGWSGASAAAAQAGEDLYLRLNEMVERGAYEHALRFIELQEPRFPGDERLRERKERIAALVQADRGWAGGGAAGGKGVGLPRLPAAGAGGPAAGVAFTTETAEIGMVWIAPGSFTMRAVGGSDDDTRVTISRGFWLGRTEVTQEQWRALMDHLPGPSYFKGSERPVERIAWVSAVEYCQRLTERERAAGRLPPGYVYQLPTEAQWEYACRAGTTGPLADGLAEVAWYERNSEGRTHPVGRKQPNNWGLHDMHGNVWEWVRDGLGGYPGGEATDPWIDYTGPSAATHRIIRGGGWLNSSGQCRADFRAWQNMNFLSSSLGFRVALAPVETAYPE
jgi:formylglycine-generating enzyme required for sulfatase activity